jgi:IPT/TIG domain
MLLAVGCGGNTGPSSTAPTVSSIDPNHGPAGGGTSIHIVGNHFAGGATVMIGGAPATEVIVESATSITAKTTAHQTGASDVTVAVGGRNGTLPGAFNYDTDTRMSQRISPISTKRSR